MKSKRQSYKRAKQGELTVSFGLHEGSMDIVYCNGPGTHSGDARLLYQCFGVIRGFFNYDHPPHCAPSEYIKYEPSLIKELEARGYDLSTLKFSIKKKPGA